MRHKLQIGEKAPDFALKDENGNDFIFESGKFKRKLVVFFYPKDDSAVCTAQACAFRNHAVDLVRYQVEVIGINSGSIESHRQFAHKHQLGYRLLSDTNKAVLNAFGVKKTLFFTGRETFVIDEDGFVVFKYRNFVRGKSHLDSVLEFLKNGDKS